MNWLNDVSRILDAAKVDYDFYFEDLVTGEVARIGLPKRFPFCSCYKLAVLGACLDSPEIVKRLNKEVTLSDGEIRTLALGVTNFLQTPITLSVSNLIRLMMAYSDGSASDMLTSMVGLAKVQNYVERVTDDSLVTNDIEGLLSKLLDRSKDLSGGAKLTREVYLDAIKSYTVAEDYTNAKDLVLLLKHLIGSGSMHREYLFRSAGVPRSSMYCPPDVQIYGKTGTLGFWVSVNDCGVVVRNGVPVAAFGLTTLGWSLPRYLIEHHFGEIGRIICLQYSDAYCPSYG